MLYYNSRTHIRDRDLRKLGLRIFSNIRHYCFLTQTATIDRLLGNSYLHLKRSDSYLLISHELLKGNTQPLFIIDCSGLITNRDYHVLRVLFPPMAVHCPNTKKSTLKRNW